MMAAMNGKNGWKGLLFSLASQAAVLAVLFYASWLWPVRLPANSQNIFWLASGVNTAGLLLLGMRWWPVILLNAIPAWLLAGEPLDISCLGSLANAFEALLGAWLIRRFGGFQDRFASTSSVGALIVASLVAPLANTLLLPAWFCLRGVMSWSEYFHAAGNWNLANGAAMLMITPLVVQAVIAARRKVSQGRWGERVSLCLVAGVLSIVAFNALFSGSSLNLTFLAFPVVIYTAMRFGSGDVALVLGTVLVGVYVALSLHSRDVAVGELVSAIWFTQAFCWVLAATGLLVAALSKERDRAQMQAARERARVLEISLSEERSRLETLKYQMHPHFLFNSLNSIYSTLPIEARSSREMLTGLCRFLRSTLKERESDWVSIEEEIELARQYLEIERGRFGDEIDLEIHLDPSAAGWKVPSFLLQPLVENAMVHGFNRGQGDFTLRFCGETEGDCLVFSIENSGHLDECRSEGLGLRNTRRRLELLYGGRASFVLSSVRGRVKICLRLPRTVSSAPERV